jgi:hypothetical protein
VRKPTEDISSYSYKLSISKKFRLNSFVTSSVNGSTGEDGNNDTTDETQGISVDAPQCDPQEEEAPGDRAIRNEQPNPNDALIVDNSTAELETLLLETALHVKKARAMGALVNDKIATARQHRQHSVPQCDRVYCFVADYCQNMALPHFGEHQPGDTYYYTPTKLQCFGIADVSFVSEGGEEADHLYLYCYGEGYGTKGGINVASMIMKTLKKLGKTQSDSNGQPIRGNELNIVMDNCG